MVYIASRNWEANLKFAIEKEMFFHKYLSKSWRMKEINGITKKVKFRKLWKRKILCRKAYRKN